MVRPKVAVIATTCFADSHADVVVSQMLEGYEFNGTHTQSRIDVVSLYLEQVGAIRDNRYVPDIGADLAERNGVERFATVAEAIGRGGPGVQVDGVVIIGEHGDYEVNEFGQKLYPRRRLFDAAVATMIGAGRVVPVFNDKHLAWSFSDAQAMVETARRLRIPLLAGSSVPLAWRIPTGAEWPWSAPMTAAVAVGYGPTEAYGFHILEGLQCHVERRSGGESGVVAVRALSGRDAVTAANDGSVDRDLLAKAFGAFDLDGEQQESARHSVKDIFLIDYADGMRAAAVNCAEVVRGFSAACRGPEHDMACQMWLETETHGHFTFLVRQIEKLMLESRTPYPIERTLLTTGILDVAMRSRHDAGTRRETPQLVISYQPAPVVMDTGISLPLPWATITTAPEQ